MEPVAIPVEIDSPQQVLRWNVDDGVRVVAVWPKVQLAPRESTELYVVFGREAVSPPKARPSVLTGDWTAPPSGREEPTPRRQPEPEPARPADAMARLVDTLP